MTTLLGDLALILTPTKHSASDRHIRIPMTTQLIREHTKSGWIIRPINDTDDLDELDRADFENLMDDLADQEACNMFGGSPIKDNTPPTQITLF